MSQRKYAGVTILNKELSYCTWSAGPLPSWRDFGDVGVLCTFSKTRYQPAVTLARIIKKIAAEQLLGSAGGTEHTSTSRQAVRPANHSTNYRPPPPPQLDRAGCLVGSFLYGLWPLWCKLISKFLVLLKRPYFHIRFVESCVFLKNMLWNPL
jgi:hypothetical protein